MTTTNRIERFLSDDSLLIETYSPLQEISPTQQRQYKITVAEMDSTMEGATEMPNILPRADLVQLIEQYCSEEEKQQFFDEVSRAAVDSIRINNVEALRQLFLDWEYTALWKTNAGAVRMLEEHTEAAKSNREETVDWRSFLSE